MEEKKKKAIISAIIILATCLGGLIVLITPILIKAHKQAIHVTCLSNQKQIAVATFMWVQENKEKMPGTDFWKVLGLEGKVLRCPKDINYKKSGNSYVYNRAVAGQYLKNIKDPQNTVLTAEGEHAATYNTKANIAYSAHDLRYRHYKGVVYSRVDGSTVSRGGDIDPKIEDLRPGTRIAFKMLKDSFGDLDYSKPFICQDGWSGEGVDSEYANIITINTRHDNKVTASKSGIFDPKYSKVMAEFDWIAVPHSSIKDSITMNISICGPSADSAVDIKLSTENNTFELITERETFTKKIKRKPKEAYHFSIIIDSETKTGTITVTNRGEIIWLVEGFALNKTVDKNKITIDAVGNARTSLANLQFGIPVIRTFIE